MPLDCVGPELVGSTTPTASPSGSSFRVPAFTTPSWSDAELENAAASQLFGHRHFVSRGPALPSSALRHRDSRRRLASWPPSRQAATSVDQQKATRNVSTPPLPSRSFSWISPRPEQRKPRRCTADIHKHVVRTPSSAAWQCPTSLPLSRRLDVLSPALGSIHMAALPWPLSNQGFLGLFRPFPSQAHSRALKHGPSCQTTRLHGWHPSGVLTPCECGS